MQRKGKPTPKAGSFSASGTQVRTERINAHPSHRTRCTSYHNLAVYGELLVGDAGIEFYNERNERDFIQIPWAEVTNVSASLVLGGRRIARFFVNTRSNGSFAFSAPDNKATLRAIREYVGDDRVVRENTVIDNIRKALRARKG